VLRRRRHLRLAGEAGVGMMELLVSLGLMAAIVAAFSGLLTATVKTSGRAQELSVLGTEARAAIDRFASDLRQAQCNGTTPAVTTATGTQITFYSPDRANPYHLRQVSYRLSGGRLDRAFATSTNTGGPPWTMPALGSWIKQVGSVVNSTAFTYLDAGGAATTNPAGVATVGITLTIQPSKGLGGAGSTSQTNVQLRTGSCS
jgi:type II secretory pathway pseudopilin PulG